MSTVFLSYRQTSEAQRTRVRKFADRLRAKGVEVILDQFFLDVHPGGPDDGWDKWSSDRALETECVLVVGTKDWFECFDKKQPPGTGLGAGCEADDIRHRIYKANGVVSSIRVVLFDEADANYIPAKLERYQRFHAERDFDNVVRWLKGREPAPGSPPHTTIPHNLPDLQPFFGREEELRRIADALDPDSRTWGALIDGPGGMGKTSLAVRAAYDARPDTFDKIAFISLKSRELDDEGERDLSGFLISGLAELFNELARELGHADIAKATEDQRPRLLIDALKGTKTLLLLDNLESLTKTERDTVFTLVKKLPHGCKAILTSRVRIGSGAEELILQELGEEAAMETLAKLAETNLALAKTSETDRRLLYTETAGKPLLLRWTAGQIGRGSCLTLKDAIAYLRSCPKGNDPLEFIFGDLVEDFSEAETRALCALTYFTLPAKVEHLAVVAERGDSVIESALKALVNRSLVVPSEELTTFALVPLVADFLRAKRPALIQETGDRLQKHVYALVAENGGQQYSRFSILDAFWPTVAASLPSFIGGANDQLQKLSDNLQTFLNYTGRWDERIALSRDAESRAIAAGDLFNAGWRAYQEGYVHFLRGDSSEVLACASRAEVHWRDANSGAREQATAIRLRGLGFGLAEDYTQEIDSYGQVLQLYRSVSKESEDVAGAHNDLARANQRAGKYADAERDYREALRIARVLNDEVGVCTFTGNLAALALERRDWTEAETLAREALSLSVGLGAKDLIGLNKRSMAQALSRQGKNSEAFPYAQQAVEIFKQLRSPRLALALGTLAECESEVAADE